MLLFLRGKNWFKPHIGWKTRGHWTPGTEPTPPSPSAKDHPDSLWFKSTLLLFLRLLLSTKKRWPAKPFFFFSLLLLPGKTGHREWYITDLQTQREWSEHTAEGLALWRTSLCPEAEECPPARGPSRRPLPAGTRPLALLFPLPSDVLAGGRPFCTEPPAVGRFPGRHSVACSNNKLVAIKADAVFS